MKTVLKSFDLYNNFLIKTHKKKIESENFKESLYIIKNKNEKGTITEIQLNGVAVLLKDIKTNNHAINVSYFFPFFNLQFEMEGSSHYTPFNKSSKIIYIPGGHYNLFYLPKVKGVLNYKTNYRKTLEIIFTENYIEKLIGKDFKNILYDFGNAIAVKKPFLMWDKSKPISIKLQGYIEEIINCKYEGNLKKAYLKTKINELLIVLLAKTNEKRHEELNVILPNVDYENILKVEKFIKKNMKKTLTIPELSLVAGVNTSKLKHDFKIIFSTTIFRYITKLRMGKAKNLIVKKKYTIAEASYKVGYKHPQHFTVAFKKVYGYLPSNLIKKNN